MPEKALIKFNFKEGSVLVKAEAKAHTTKYGYYQADNEYIIRFYVDEYNFCELLVPRSLISKASAIEVDCTDI